jgi:serine/threonine protein kinase
VSDIPLEIRRKDIQENGLLLTDNEVNFAIKLINDNFKNNKGNLEEIAVKIKKKDFFYIDENGKYILIKRDDVKSFKRPRNAKSGLLPIKDRLHLSVSCDGLIHEGEKDPTFYAIYYGNKGHPKYSKLSSKISRFIFNKEKKKTVYGRGSEATVKVIQSLNGKNKGKFNAFRVSYNIGKLEKDNFIKQELSNINELEKDYIEDLFVHTCSQPVKLSHSRGHFGIKLPRAICSLGELLDREYPDIKITFNDLIDISSRTIDGIHFMHHHGYIHRDIKPSNVLIFKSNTLPKKLISRISDFGFTDKIDTGLDPWCGTPLYMDAWTMKYISDLEYAKEMMESNLNKMREKNNLYADNISLYEKEIEIVKEKIKSAYQAIDVYALGVFMWELFGFGMIHDENGESITSKSFHNKGYDYGVTEDDVRDFEDHKIDTSNKEEIRKLDEIKILIRDMMSVQIPKKILKTEYGVVRITDIAEQSPPFKGRLSMEKVKERFQEIISSRITHTI